MRSGVQLFALCLALLVAPPTSSQGSTPQREQIQTYLDGGTVFGVEDGGDVLVRWDRALREALKTTPDFRRAAVKLKSQFGLSEADTKALAELWVLASDLNEASDADRSRFRQRFISLSKRSVQAPLVLAAAAVTWGEVGECSASELDALTDGAPDPLNAAWTLTRIRDCAAWSGAFAARFPQHATASLLLLSGSDTPNLAEQLALYDRLSTEASLSHVAESDRDDVNAALNRSLIFALFGAGVTDDAVARIERLPEHIRRKVFVGPAPARAIKVDGLDSQLWEIREEDDPGIGLAAAYALAGRTGEAGVALRSSPRLETAKRYFACATEQDGAKNPKDCGFASDFDAMLVEHLLYSPSADPYPLVEVHLAAGVNGRGTGSGVWADLACRVLNEPSYRDICKEARRQTVEQVRDGLDARRHRGTASLAPAAVFAAALPGFDEAALRFKALLDSAADKYGKGGPVLAGDGRDARADWHPAPSRFQSFPVPEQFRGAAGIRTKLSASPVVQLPEGYNLVRLERRKDRVVAISVSQNYDPTGEVSQGGYWVHISEDGGKHWGRPLYTGLADRWPFVVLPESKLPLIDGEVLNLAVEIREIDPTSIFYPPVALRSRRQERNLYLKIPISALSRDSDGDGLSDIASEHLLLEAKSTGASTPLVLGRTPAKPCSPADIGLQGAIGRFLSERMEEHTGAIILGIDAPTGKGSDPLASAFGIGKIDPNSADRPILLQGDPDDFRCLRSDRLVIVYGPQDVEKMHSFSPDFHAISLSKFVANRAGDRGYFTWSSGWTGGTIRLRIVGGRWVADELMSWIT